MKYRKKINNSTILLLGLGGGGSNILTLLSGLGPKNTMIALRKVIQVGNFYTKKIIQES